MRVALPSVGRRSILPGMDRTEAVAALSLQAGPIRAMGATSLFLFGSTARNEATATSDLDLFMDYDPASRFNAFDLLGIKHLIEDRLGASVDLTTRDALHPRLRSSIERSAIRIF